MIGLLHSAIFIASIDIVEHFWNVYNYCKQLIIMINLFTM